VPVVLVQTQPFQVLPEELREHLHTVPYKYSVCHGPEQISSHLLSLISTFAFRGFSLDISLYTARYDNTIVRFI
jgi:hypothetical protein